METTHSSHFRKRTDNSNAVKPVPGAKQELISEQAIKSIKTWQELWFFMADFDITAYNKLKSTDVIEFWSIYDVWKAKIERMQPKK